MSGTLKNSSESRKDSFGLGWVGSGLVWESGEAFHGDYGLYDLYEAR